MQLIDPNHPAYRRLWVRVAIVAVCFGWAGVEVFTGDPFWAVLAGGAGAYSVYMLFWTFNPQPPAVVPPAEPDELADELPDEVEQGDGEPTDREKPSKDVQAD